VAKTRQELTWKVLDQMRATAWAEYRNSQPETGSNGSEIIAGIGYYGKPDPRIYTELRIGWDFVSLEQPLPGQDNLSGLRFNGWTTFDWSERLRLTLRYDRDYVFNEEQPDDNYVSTLLQARAEVFLGGNWYLTPYFGASLQEFQTSHQVTLQLRPEIEAAYAFAGAASPANSKIFLKIGYMTSSYLVGEGLPVENWRFSLGLNCKF